MTIEYRHSLEGIVSEQLRGFFEGWPSPPSPETHLAILRSSDEVVLAVSRGEVIGYVTALSDRILSAYVPLLEVRRESRGRGIGRELVRRLLDRLADLYMVDVTCDPEIQPFYEALGFRRSVGASLRRYELQAGASRT